MTAAELDELEALANAATPGPWTSYDRNLRNRIMGVVTPNPGIAILVYEMDGRPVGLEAIKSNAAFIAAASEAVPKLIARIRVLEDLLDQMEALLDEPPCDHCNNCDEGCWGPRRESMQDRGSRAQRGQLVFNSRDDE